MVEEDGIGQIAAAEVIADDVAAMIRRLSAKYCWDSSPDRASAEVDRIILRALNLATWEDTLELERVAGSAALREVLTRASTGALSPRAWSFWHYRLGLADVDHPPPPQPDRMGR